MNRAIPLLGAWFLVLHGAAQFGPQQIIESNEAAHLLAQVVLDVDEDGFPDLVASLQTDNVIVWYANDGAGGFGPQQVLVPDAVYINTLATADLDADGIPDLVGTSVQPERLVWWKNLGGGAFGAEQPIGTPSSQPSCLLAMDVDTDGLLDLLVGTHYLGTLEYGRNLGDGNFTPLVTIDSPGVGLHSLAKGDLDGDGIEDLLTARYNATTSEVAWYSNTGEGAFSTRQVVYFGPDTLNAAGLADLNGDGHLDVYRASYQEGGVVVYFNNGTGDFSPPAVAESGSYKPALVIAADMDQDGDMDLVLSSMLPYSLRWVRNEGNGAFSPGSVLATTLVHARSIHVTDLDGDGPPDVSYCTSDSRVAFHRNLGNGQFGPQQEATTQVRGASWVSTGDLDGDGHRDVLSASKDDHRIAWYRNLGNGQFDVQRTISNTVLGTRCAIPADIDGDGDADVIATSWTTHGIVAFRNDGAGTFSAPEEISNTANRALDVMAADLDQDGDLDLVVRGYSYLAYHLNEGSGSFMPAVVFTGYVTGEVPFDLADLDGDGLLDVVHSTSGYSRLAWFRNLGNGQFSSQIVIVQYVSGALVKAADIDRDGQLDIVLGTQPMRWYRNNGEGAFATAQTFGSENSDSDALLVFDVDGDSYVDVITAHGNLNQIAMYRNLGNGNFGPRTVIPAVLEGPLCLHAANVDMNSSKELFCASWQDDKLFWHRNYFGSHFRAQGRRYIDLDLDGTPGPDEPGMAWGQLACTPTLTYALTTANGDYYFSLDTGTWHISSFGQGTLWDLVTTPSTYNVELTEVAPMAAGLDFGYAANTDTSIIASTIVLGNGPCGGTVPLWITFANQGTRIEQGTVSLAMDPAITFVSSVPPPASQDGNLFTWNFDSLNFFESRSIELVVERPGLAAMGSSVTSTLGISTVDDGGSATGSWQTILTETVTCAYDPNDKLVEPIGYGEAGAVPIDTDALIYTIRFQNTGTAEAWNVVLRDQLAGHLDRSRFEVLGFSHTPTHISIDAVGELMVRFDGIMLPDSGADLLGSQGFFRFRIGVNEGLAHMTAITNTAEIDFDINPPIVTNTTLTTLVDCSLWEPQVAVAHINLLEATEGDAYQWFLAGDSIPGANGQVLAIAVPGSYSCAVTSPFGCTAWSADLVVLTIQVPEHTAFSASVVPNPFDEQVRVLFSRSLDPSHILVLMDAYGREVRKWQGNASHELRIDRDGLAPGPYMLQVLSAEGQVGLFRIVAE
jgi:hypothetical protein